MAPSPSTLLLLSGRVVPFCSGLKVVFVIEEDIVVDDKDGNAVFVPAIVSDGKGDDLFSFLSPSAE